MKSELMQGSNWFRHQDLSKKISICMSKVKYGYLTMDNRIQSHGISLTSKFDCRSKPEIETIDHVLCIGDFA